MKDHLRTHIRKNKCVHVFREVVLWKMSCVTDYNLAVCSQAASNYIQAAEKKLQLQLQAGYANFGIGTGTACLLVVNVWFDVNYSAQPENTPTNGRVEAKALG